MRTLLAIARLRLRGSGRRGRRPAPAALLALLGAIACTGLVAPSTRVLGSIDEDAGRLLYVTANDERETVIAELERAGFATTLDAGKTPLALAVRLGNERAKVDCGVVRNVVYQLRQSGSLVAVIKGRGWFGSCEPSILGQMNAALARLIEPRR